MAYLGHSVTCIDNDHHKVQSLQQGKIQFFEPGLSELLDEMRSAGRISFSSSASEIVSSCDFVFLCLPTPSLPNGDVNLSYLVSAVKDLEKYLTSGTVVVTKSTVPVNSAKLIREMITNPAVEVVSNPEFLREGSAVSDFLSPERIIVGATSRLAGERVKAVYSQISAPVLITDPATAESIKYLANAYLALRITFVNEVAGFCESLNADVADVLAGLMLDSRIGTSYFSPGPGWGGSCFPKDTRALTTACRNFGTYFRTIESAIESNASHIERIVDWSRSKIEDLHLVSPRIAILGLSFKANTDDIRESPSVIVAKRLLDMYGTLVVFDPRAREIPELEASRVMSLTLALKNSDVLIIATDWEDFAKLKPSTVRNLMRGSLILDLRYILDIQAYKNAGLEVVRFGSTDKFSVVDT